MPDNLKVFSTTQSILGEAPVWHAGRNSLFWLDILGRVLYEKPTGEDERSWPLPEYAATLAVDRHSNHILWMVTDRSFGYFELEKGEYKPQLPLRLKAGQRANDGSVSFSGDFFFGSMSWRPEDGDGEIFSITPTGKIVNQGLHLGIPNTFCWDAAGTHIIISDSLEQKMYKFRVNKGKIEGEYREFLSKAEENCGTPDGGAMDINGCLWNVLWDGCKVVKYNRHGVKIREIALPVLRPTSCCFGGKNNQQLFITSARVDMTTEELKKHPLSGQVLIADVGVRGAPVFPYSLDV